MSTSRTLPPYPFLGSSSTTSEPRSSEWDGNAVYWRGHPSYQQPADLIRYQELIWEHRPDWVIETGGGGGTTGFLIDLGISWVWTTQDSLAEVPDLSGTVMAILDSDVYSLEHMRAEIAAYAPLVTEGQHLIVCHTDRPDWGARPALAEYLANNQGMFTEEQAPVGSLCTYLRR